MRSAEAVATMLGPICKTGLTLSDRSGVEIDYCRRVAGSGSTATSSTRSSSAAPRMRHRHDATLSSQGRITDRKVIATTMIRYPHSKRKKSFLSGMFD